MARPSPNREVLLLVAREIAPLLPNVVFVGGQVAELLVTAPEANQIRPTLDVDVVVAATTRVEYRRVEESLEALGLQPDSSEGAPVCRWLTSTGLKLDVMPKGEDVLGFHNRWFSAVMEEATAYALADDLEIWIPPAPLFLAAKWDAFRDRGEGDLLGSHDLEDIITVVAGRHEVIGELTAADPEVSGWLAARAGEFLAHPDANYALEGALTDARTIPGLVATVRRRFEAITSFGRDQ